MSTESNEPSNALVSRMDEPQLPMTTPHDLLSLAVSKGADMATLERLMDLQDRYDAKQAKNAYVAAMAEFKKNPPDIYKRTRVYFEPKNGGTPTDYMHANLGDVCDAIVKPLAEFGFSHSWEMVQAESGQIQVTCVLTHKQGHSERVMLKAGADQTGGKNAIQAVVSTKTYLERHTLLAVVGMATKELDDDGRGGFDANGEPFRHVSPEEQAKLDAAQRKRVHDEAFGRHSESIAFIKDRLTADDLKAAREEWKGIPQPDQIALWLAPSKGGCLTTTERETLRGANNK